MKTSYIRAPNQTITGLDGTRYAYRELGGKRYSSRIFYTFIGQS